MDPMDLATWAGGALLVVGAVGALYRIVRGPSLLDRAVATDVLLAIVGAGLAIEMVYNHHSRSEGVIVMATFDPFSANALQ